MRGPARAANHFCAHCTYIDDLGYVTGLQIMEDTSFVEVGKDGHVFTHLKLGGIHGLGIVDVNGDFLKIMYQLMVVYKKRYHANLTLHEIEDAKL